MTMKLTKLALTLTAAALLPTFAFASADPVAASFDRDLQRNTAIESVIVAKSDADPLDIINKILNQTPDVVVASFDRDLYRAPTATPAAPAWAADPLEAINVAFRSEGSNEQGIVLASFERDLNRVPTTYVAVNTEAADPLVEAFNVAFYGTSTTDQVLASFERDLNRTIAA